jgi:hypothetical protein
MSQNTKTFSKPDHLSFTLEQFHNDQIDAILARSNNWRRMEDSPVDKYAHAMRIGKWDSGNGECLAFDASGRLVNGQHRLAAARIVQEETGRRIWFWVARNVMQNAVESMDQGRNRKVVECLRNEGVVNAPEVAAIASAAARRAMVRDDATLWSILGHANVYPTNGQVLDVYRKNPAQIEEWASASNKLRDSAFPRSGMLSALLYQFAMQDEQRARLFFKNLHDGSGLNKNDPIFVLREILLADRASKNKRNKHELAALFIKAWVAWNEGRAVSVLRWIAVGPRAEKFPDHRFEAV